MAQNGLACRGKMAGRPKHRHATCTTCTHPPPSLLHLPLQGLPADGSAASPGKPKLSFKLYFPQPPYRGAKYTAALSKADRLFNFVGLVLGHHGKTIQRIQKASGARVEVHDASGNLNGEHPAHDDPSLHALVMADSRPKLEKAVMLLLDVLAPTNTTYHPVKVGPGREGGWARAAALCQGCC